MPKITSLDDLNKLKVKLVMKQNQAAHDGVVRVTVGMGTCGIAAGAQAVFDALKDQIERQELQKVQLSQTGCVGLCSYEPIVEVSIGDAPKVSYGWVTPMIARRIVQEHILDGKPIEEFIIDATPFPTI